MTYWTELRTLFDELSDLDEGARGDRLREVGTSDPGLRRELEALLAADRDAADRLRAHERAAAHGVLAATAGAGKGGRGPRDPLDLIGSTVSHYRIESVLAAGGMGVIYRATDVALGRVTALKFLPPAWSFNDRAKQRFLREARAASSLDHPNVCTIYEAGETADGTLFIAMPCYEGETLEGRLRRGPLDPDEAIDLAMQAAQGLEAAHARDMVHRDIKPSNLFLTGEGTLKILDFGVTKTADTGLTAPEQRPGTAAYMAPEQAGSRPVDGRADVWALGIVLTEMLTGSRPAAQGSGGPKDLSEEQPGLPVRIGELVGRMLAPEAADRPTAAEVARRLAGARTADPDAGYQASEQLRRKPGPLAGRRGAAAVAGVCLLLLTGAGAWFTLRARGAGEAAGLSAAALESRIEELAAERRFAEAYELAENAEKRSGSAVLPDSLWTQIADRITVTSEPPGATVLAARYPDRESDDSSGPAADEPGTPAVAGPGEDAQTPGDPGPVVWRELGVTPLDSLRIPRGDYVLRIEREGFAPAEASASSALLRVMPRLPRAVHHSSTAARPADERRGADIRLHIVLADRDAPDDMVFVPGGPYELVSRDVAGLTASLEDFFLDRFEVTNAEFARFVNAGGYRNEDLWRGLVDDYSAWWARVENELTDRTGLAAPRGWIGRQYPSGRADHPVTGVTWYEAAAYCRYRGRRLPTLFEWEKAARDGTFSRFEGVMMPWGLYGPHGSLRLRANFSGNGTAPVDAHPFGVSPYGAYGMAGNVKEWLINPTADGRATTGGSWEDPLYMFAQIGSLDPLASSPAVGFRCARSAGSAGSAGSAVSEVSAAPPTGEAPTEPPAMAQGAGLIRLDVPSPSYEPVDRRTFEALLSHYRYDPLPADAMILESVDQPGWKREKVAFNGPRESRILAYLYLPRATQPPFQTLLFVPGVDAFLGNPVTHDTEWLLAPVIRSGRAVFTVVMSGMTERAWEDGRHMPEPGSTAFRDLMVLHATEMRLGLDYLETRSDIDTTAFGYVGFSMGAGSRLVFAAVDDRFDTVIFLGGGIDERMQPTLPEANNVNFAPYIDAPTLLLNGREDEEHLWERRARPLWNLLTEPKELVLVEGAGHVPLPEARVPAMLDWLDRTLGPVR